METTAENSSLLSNAFLFIPVVFIFVFIGWKVSSRKRREQRERELKKAFQSDRKE